jgi:hypothetical protein
MLRGISKRQDKSKSRIRVNNTDVDITAGLLVPKANSGFVVKLEEEEN